MFSYIPNLTYSIILPETLRVSGRIMEFFQCGTAKRVATFCHFSKRGAFQKW
jgi:hypothetical protein